MKTLKKKEVKKKTKETNNPLYGLSLEEAIRKIAQPNPIRNK